MSFQPSPRPGRFFAFLLLLSLHAALVVFLVSIKSSVEVRRAELVTRLLSLLPDRRAPRAQPSALPMPAPRLPAVPRFALPPLPLPGPADSTVRPEPAPVIALPASGSAPSTASASAGAASGPAAGPGGKLDLSLHKDFYDQERDRERHLSPAEEALRDPRSNKLVLTRHEQIMIDFGEAECIAWQREPDGSIYRGPGHLKRVTDVPMGGKEIYECVK